MPIALTSQLEDQKRKAKGQGAVEEPTVLAGQSSVVDSSASGGGSGETKTGGSTSSGHWTNLNKYLDANAGNKTGDRVAGKIIEKGEQAVADVKKEENAAVEQANQSVQTVDSDLWTKDPEKLTPEEVEKIKAAQAFKPETPKPFTLSQGAADKIATVVGTPDYQTTADDKDSGNAELKTGGLAGATESEGGRFAVLREIVKNPTYSFGSQKLDQMLLQNDPESQKALAGVREKAKEWAGATKQATENVTAAQNAAAATSAAEKDRLNKGLDKKITDTKSAIESQVASVNAANKALNDQEEALLNAGINGYVTADDGGRTYHVVGPDGKEQTYSYDDVAGVAKKYGFNYGDLKDKIAAGAKLSDFWTRPANENLDASQVVSPALLQRWEVLRKLFPDNQDIQNTQIKTGITNVAALTPFNKEAYTAAGSAAPNVNIVKIPDATIAADPNLRYTPAEQATFDNPDPLLQAADAIRTAGGLLNPVGPSITETATRVGEDLYDPAGSAGRAATDALGDIASASDNISSVLGSGGGGGSGGTWTQSDAARAAELSKYPSSSLDERDRAWLYEYYRSNYATDPIMAKMMMAEYAPR